jgi:hypothetical protein
MTIVACTPLLMTYQTKIYYRPYIIINCFIYRNITVKLIYKKNEVTKAYSKFSVHAFTNDLSKNRLFEIDINEIFFFKYIHFCLGFCLVYVKKVSVNLVH